MELNAYRGSFECVVKKRELLSSECHKKVDSISGELEQALSRMQSDQDFKSILKDLKSNLNELKPKKELDPSEKELNSIFNTHLKLLEKEFISDISKGYWNLVFDVQTTDQIITDHLYSVRLIDVGDSFVEEAGTPEDNGLRSQIFELSEILQALRTENIQPALKWVSINQEKLKEDGSNLMLKLHRVLFVELLKKGNDTDILNYARANLAPLADSHTNEIQELMTALLWIGNLEKCPDFQLLKPTMENLMDELSQQFFLLLGRSVRSPLEVAVEAGSKVLPTILKYMKVSAVQQLDWQTMNELPFPVDLGNDFLFHSTFICPVSRDQETAFPGENPPFLLPCGHVLCWQSIWNMSSSLTTDFKCPYCRLNAAVGQWRLLHL